MGKNSPNKNRQPDPDEKSTTELDAAKAKRKVLRTAITKDTKKVLAMDELDATGMVSAKVILARLEWQRKEVGVCDNIILDQADHQADLAEEIEAAMGYQTALNDAIVKLTVLLQNAQKEEESASAQLQPGAAGQVPPRSATVKMPKLELTKFSGDPLRWEEFYDDFVCSVDSRTDLTTIDKFKILKQSLKGEALSVADGYYLTQRNYEEVKEALKDRFGDTQVAIFAHFEALLDLPRASHNVDDLVRTRDKCEAHIRSLSALGLIEDTFGLVFAPILLSKLPRFVQMELHRKNGSKKWTLATLRELLKDEIQARAKSDRGYAGNLDESTEDKKKRRGRLQPKGTATALMVHAKGKGKGFASEANSQLCIFCGGKHRTWDCSKCATLDARFQIVKRDRRCFVCLSDKHRKPDCKSTNACRYCDKGNHHSSLCYQQFGTQRSASRESAKMVHEVVPPLNVNAQVFVPTSVNVVNEDPNRVKSEDVQGTAVFESARVRICGTKGPIIARAILDNASSTTLIRKKTSREVGAREVNSRYQWTQLNRAGEQDGKCRRLPKVRFQLTLTDGSTMDIVAREIEHVAAPIRLIPLNLQRTAAVIRKSPFAEVLVDQPQDAEVDILIGLNYYNRLVGDTVCRLTEDLVIKESRLGNIVSGYVPETTNDAQRDNEHYMLMVESPGGRCGTADLEQFWSLENIGIKDPPGQEDDEQALEMFNRTIQVRNKRAAVCWPMKTESPDLPENKLMAEKQLKSVHRTLMKKPDLLGKYDGIFQEQKRAGIIEEAPEIPTGLVHYLPHHAVVTPGKETTKVRVVFNASAKASPSVPSLNDIMHRGPVFLNNACGMLIRFRLPKVAITADVEKAFLQVELQESQRDCTRFFWVRDSTMPPFGDNLITFRYARVPFGVKASPFLLAASIRHHMKDVGSETALEIVDNIYMDNVFGGRTNTREACGYYREAKGLFSDISMNLREWYSNDPEFIATLPTPDKGRSKEPSVLGVKWNLSTDTIRCSVGLPENKDRITKRTILTTCARTYDPCGWLAPVTIRGRILLQDLWRSGQSWDEAVPPEKQDQWLKICRDLKDLRAYTMPRQYFSGVRDGQASWELHVFCDGSSRAYVAAIYLRNSLTGSCALLFAKARVAPMKELSIPRLELMAALIGTRLLTFVDAELGLTIARKWLWSDSRCVLAWVKRERVTSVFVENRLKEIRKASGISFAYVNTKQNPADLATRGATAKELVQSNLWRHGPPWLTLDETEWPPQPEIHAPQAGEHCQICCETACLATDSGDEIVSDEVFELERFSTLTRLIRVTCYVFRAIKAFKKQGITSANVKAAEWQNALDFWVKRIQSQHFQRLYKPAKAARWRNMVGQLGLFTDRQGFIRARGRFQNAENLKFDTKCPKLLPKKSLFTDMVIRNAHQQVMHSGPKHTLAEVQKQYWVPGGRSVVRIELTKCPVCRKCGGGPFRVPENAPLPDFRSSVRRPFACVGLDYLGPLHVKENGESKKVWIALFTCAVVRALHLEVVASLTSTDFLLALRRFVALYGVPEVIVSDNATQFKLAEKVIQRAWKDVIDDQDVQDYCSSKGIDWRYIVERAAWMGGFYERLVAPVKAALKRTIGNWMLTEQELHTIVYEVAAVLNSRPLTGVASDPSDTMLTPAHLLFRSAEMFPEGSTEYDPDVAPKSKMEELMRHWKAGQALLKQFWVVWREQYLLTLREYWTPIRDRGASDTCAREGMVVLIKDELPRGMWKMARITKLRMSKDGKIRSAELKLPNGKTLLRPLRLLYPVEGTENQNQVEARTCDEEHDEDTPGPSVPAETEARQPRRAAAASRAKTREMLAE